jgi:hypothetical protein
MSKTKVLVGAAALAATAGLFVAAPANALVIVNGKACAHSQSQQMSICEP